MQKLKCKEKTERKKVKQVNHQRQSVEKASLSLRNTTYHAHLMLQVNYTVCPSLRPGGPSRTGRCLKVAFVSLPSSSERPAELLPVLVQHCGIVQSHNLPFFVNTEKKRASVTTPVPGWCYGRTLHPPHSQRTKEEGTLLRGLKGLLGLRDLKKGLRETAL